MLSLRNWLQKSETSTLVSIVEKQQDRHQFTQATSSMKQETTDLQAIHTTSKLCAIIATSIDDTKTQSKQVNDSMKNDLEDMMNFKRNTLNIWINEALTSIECLKEIKNWESNVKKWKLIFQNSNSDKNLFHKQNNAQWKFKKSKLIRWFLMNTTTRNTMRHKSIVLRIQSKSSDSYSHLWLIKTTSW